MKQQPQLQQALVPVSKMVIKFGLHCHEFKKNIQQAYIQAAIEILNESGIKVTNQAIAVKTGIDRRTIAEIRKQNFANDKNMNKMDLILQALKQHKDQHGKQLSHTQISQIIDRVYAGHIRAKAVIDELLSNQIISKQQQKYQINQSLQHQLDKQSQLADEVDLTTKRLFRTFYQKMFSANEPGHLNQATVCSTKIPNRHHQEINRKIAEKMLQFQQQMTELMSQYEANVSDNSFANVGFSQFQFDAYEKNP